MENELNHYGILGMKWGVRRYQNKDGTLTNAGKKRISKAEFSKSKTTEKASSNKGQPDSKKKSVHELTDEELNAAIKRIELEKRYADLTKPAEQKKSNKGRAFVADVLEKSGKNVATQLTTYALGTLVNKAFAKYTGDDAIVNPKKGQKDK